MNQTASLRVLYRLGLVFYAAQLILALIFYKERTVFIDAALHLFEITRDGDLAIQNSRFGAAFTQAFPIAGVAAGASLPALMLLYSAAFIVLHALVYFLCRAVGSPRAGLVLLLTDSLFATDTFFWIQSELPQGLAMACLLLALAESPRLHPVVAWLAMLALVPVVAFMHPLLVFPVAAWALHRIAGERDNRQRIRHAALLIAYIVCVVVKSKFFKNPYDSGAFEGLDNFELYFPDYFHLYANKRLLLRIASGAYILLPTAAIAIALLYIRRRAWFRLLLTLGFIAGYGLLIQVCYPGPEVQAFYIENMYLPLATMLAVPLVYDALPAIGRPRLMHGVLTAVLLLALLRFTVASRPFSERLSWMRALVDKTGDLKLIIPTAIAPMDLLKMEWGTAYEAWLLSTTERGPTASLIITPDPSGMQAQGNSVNQFVGPWGPTNYADLPRRYFHFGDSVSTYRVAVPADLPPVR